MGRGGLQLVFVVQARQPGGQTLNRNLELGIEVDELTQPISQPGQRDVLVTAPGGKFLDASIGEIHDEVTESPSSLLLDAEWPKSC